jgi:hypothetical protein
VTLARIKATGSGALSFRLEIEGFAYEAVTRADMARAASGTTRARLDGLSVRGVKLSQRADIPRATIEAEGATFEIADIGEAWTRAFSADPEHTTWLTATCASNATSITVTGTAGWPSTGVLWVNSEAAAYTGKTGTTFTGLTRGVHDTLGQAHYAEGDAALRYPEVTSSHTTLAGRRVRLYAYGKGDDPTGNGTQVWLGLVSGEPRMRGATWTITVDSIASLLEQDVGGDLAQPAVARGIYIPIPASASWRIYRKTYVSGSSTPVPPTFAAATSDHTIQLPDGGADGFWETQEAFLADLNDRLDTLTSSWNTQVSAVAYGDSYAFQIKTNSTPDGVSIASRPDSAACDPTFSGEVWSDGVGGVGTGRVIALLQNTTHWAVPLQIPGRPAGAGSVPRGLFRSRADLFGNVGSRVYLARGLSATVNSTAAAVEIDGDTYQVEVVSPDLTTNSVRAVAWRSDGDVFLPYTAQVPLTMSFGKQLMPPLGTVTLRGTHTLLKFLEDNAAVQVNLAALPMFQVGDWNATEWFDAYAGLEAYATQRVYVGAEPTPLGELVSPDLQLAGLYLAIDGTGRLTCKPLRLATVTEPTTLVIDKSNLLTDDGPPSYELGAIGRFNEIVLNDGYDPYEDEYTATPVHVRDVAAFGRSPTSRAIRIEPKSIYLGGAIPPEAAVALAETVLGIYGGPYAYVTCDVPLTALDVSIGDTVSITTKQLPSTTGTRGMDAVAGIVTAREVDFYGARITLTLLTSRSRVAGYAFGGKLSARSGSGTAWDVTIDATHVPTGTTAADYVVAGDNLILYRYDSDTPGTVIANVISVAGNVVTVGTLATWTPGSDEWAVAFMDADDTEDVTANMRRFAYIAGPDAVVDFNVGGAAPARTFAPGA